MKYTIDRFEENFAVVELENRSFVNIPISALPSEAKEGDIISVLIDTEETTERRKKIQSMMQDLWAD
ncbi:MAG: DUF3006 domain-containing protein [Clostridium sp.]|uniref:DUF3006 domain-containing protein n=1 Tax=Clostridium sp. TaxID=1506 RepID=UPI00290E9C03|nr:DUF3006 domain-containing protein [Clostridium sp.]MDU7338624.1 DUF3006 domain-containing protein [Clostridium sp.]